MKIQMLYVDTCICYWIIRSLWGERGRNLELRISFYNSHKTDFEKKQEKYWPFLFEKNGNMKHTERRGGNSVKKKKKCGSKIKIIVPYYTTRFYQYTLQPLLWNVVAFYGFCCTWKIQVLYLQKFFVYLKNELSIYNFISYYVLFYHESRIGTLKKILKLHFKKWPSSS